MRAQAHVTRFFPGDLHAVRAGRQRQRQLAFLRPQLHGRPIEGHRRHARASRQLDDVPPALRAAVAELQRRGRRTLADGRSAWLTESMASVVPFAPFGRVTCSDQLFTRPRHEAEHPRRRVHILRAAPARKPSNDHVPLRIDDEAPDLAARRVCGQRDFERLGARQARVPLRAALRRRRGPRARLRCCAPSRRRSAPIRRSPAESPPTSPRAAARCASRTVSSVQSRSRLNTRSTRTNAGNSLPASSVAPLRSASRSRASSSEPETRRPSLTPLIVQPRALTSMTRGALRKRELNGFRRRQTAREPHGVRARRERHPQRRVARRAPSRASRARRR